MLELLIPMAKKYFSFGIHINVQVNVIEKIQKHSFNHEECLIGVLSFRLKQKPSLTWNDIDTALRSPIVGEGKLADSIKQQYGHLYTHNTGMKAILKPQDADNSGADSASSKIIRQNKEKGDSVPKNVKQATGKRKPEEGKDTLRKIKDTDSAEAMQRPSMVRQTAIKPVSNSTSTENDTPVTTKGQKRMRDNSPTFSSGSESGDTYQQRRYPSLRKKRKQYRRRDSSSTSSSSDTDESSSPIIQNVSEDENKKFIKIFRSFFGRICSDIKDPVEIAIQLHKNAYCPFQPWRK